MERAPRTEAFPRWPSSITRPGHITVPPSRSAPKSGTVRPVGFAALRAQGWTIWFGRHTRQYWAAHTPSMRLVCADTAEELLSTATALTAPPRH